MDTIIRFPTLTAIRNRAYTIYLARGSQAGHDQASCLSVLNAQDAHSTIQRIATP